jgi:two-component system chemotaxis sensor kinase CheA
MHIFALMNLTGFFMSAFEHINKALSYLPLVDNQDLSILPSIITELEQATSDTSIPDALKIQIKRSCKLAEHITLCETDFDTGIQKLSQNITRLLSHLEKSSRFPHSDQNIEQLVDICENDTDIITQKNNNALNDEIRQFRDKFASSQKSILDDIEAHILQFEKGDLTSIQSIKRILHTWKGEFGVLELPQYSSVIHQIEEAIEYNFISADQLLYFKDFLSNNLPHISQEGSNKLPESLYTKLFTKKAAADTSSVHKNDTTSEESNEIIQYFPHTPPLLDIDKSLLSDFIIESRDHIVSAENLILELEQNPTSQESINSIFRSCHTIKGVAGFLNLVDLSQLSHCMENLMDRCRKGEVVIQSAHVDLLLKSMDCLKELILTIEKCMQGELYSLPAAYNEIMIVLHNPGKHLQSKTSIQTPNDTGEDFFKKQPVERDAFVPPDDSSQERPSEHVPDQTVPVSETQASTSAKKPAANLEDTIRVPVNRLDQLIDAIGEAVIAQSMITADPLIKSATSQTLTTKITQTNMIMRQIQELSMSLRMISLKATFQKMARLARDLSKKSGKEILFSTEGEDTELDKSVVENISDPLIHMIRNSVDHGLESNSERVAKGKPSVGNVTLKAYHKAGNVYIEIIDDGKGLDKESIYKKAVSKGLCNETDKLSELEIFQFIFLPGFSTAKTVTDISGRGVGMDVVKRNIESLRGSIEIESEKDKGTTFRIRLPLTLAIIDGMIVRVDNSTYIVPTLSIIETLAASKSSVVTVLEKGEMIKIREHLVPLVHMSSTFNNNYNNRLSDKAKVALIVEDMVGRRSALIVDEILGQQQVVIKSLGVGIGDVQGISGGAIMSDGTVSLIVDVGGIIKSIYN